MDQDGGRHVLATESHSDSSNEESRPNFLDVPVEIFLKILEHLDPVSANLLALTCKSTKILVAPVTKELTIFDRKDVLLSLERDPIIGKYKYFCPGCAKLHSYQPWWGPGVTPCDQWDLRSEPLSWSTPQHEVLEFNPRGSSLKLRFDHARLIMNRHLYGPTYGLPLTRLTLSATPNVDQDIVAKQDMTARIINNRLVLKCKHTLEPANESISIEDFRYAIDRCFLEVCLHVSVHTPTDYSCRLSQLGYQNAGHLFFSCQDAIDACRLCCTDFETSIKVDKGKCSITIVSYHLMGACRDPWDSDCSFMFEGNPLRRNFNRYPFKSIKRMWHDT